MTLPGMRERTVAHRLGRQDLLADRLEGRLRHRRAGAPRPDRQGAPVHHLHHAAQSAEGGRLRPRQGRRLLRGAGRRPRGEARPLRRGPARGSASAWCPAQGTYFITADMAPLGIDEPTTSTLCQRHDGRGRRHGGAGLRLLPVGRADRLSSASASPSATRCSTRRSSGSANGRRRRAGY